ncbi:ABC transporter permease [Pseudomonas granadensis]|uniref:ABC transporter permease n=1 Tax=Pseudomonas granadensis TaxID=1421430 RepID=UPI00087B4281|nr:ABC transporter permease [Pseudomonas granadensis]SDT37216.1 lipopolysaccharide transport system permease protein/teichoic acid transport system permease protein [Pseudomonas granadensis]
MSWLRAMLADRRILVSLISNDLRARYLTNYLGFLWVFIQPCATTLILWFVFQFGFKAAPHGDFPFVLWLVCGLVPWFFTVEALNSGCTAVKENSFLVKKIVFKVSLLPLVKLSSAVLVHVFFVFILLLLFVIYGYEPNLYWLQVAYYIACLFMLLLAIAWITSSVVIFFPDLSQLVAMATQFGFWLTPVFWDIDAIQGRAASYLRLNPFAYIVEGFRDSLIRDVWFWQRPTQTLFFWGVMIVLMFVGWHTFRKLRPHFADVL